MSIIAIITICLFVLATGLVLRSLIKPTIFWPEAVFATLALAGQAWLLHTMIDLPEGQNLSFTLVFSQVAWLIALIAYGLRFGKKGSQLALLSYPLALFTLVLAVTYPGRHILVIRDNVWQIAHIVFAMLTLSILCLAVIQSIICVIQERLLSSKVGFQWLETLPSLQGSETLLFQLISTGFTLLTILLLASFYFFHNPFTPALLPKTLLGVLAWLVFAILLLGRQYYGWRGRNAVRFASSGVLILALLILTSALR